MTWYDAINHGFTTMATGGFSTYNDVSRSLRPFHSIPHPCFYVYRRYQLYGPVLYAFNRKLKRVWASDEFRAYVFVDRLSDPRCHLAVLFLKVGEPCRDRLFRESSFQIVSLMTTTGYVTADYTAWGPGLNRDVLRPSIQWCLCRVYKRGH